MRGTLICDVLGCNRAEDLQCFILNGPRPSGVSANMESYGKIFMCKECASEITSGSRCDMCSTDTVYPCARLDGMMCCDGCAATLADYARTTMLQDRRLTSSFRAWLDQFGLDGRTHMPSFYVPQAHLLVQSYLRDLQTRLTTAQLFEIRARTRLRDMGVPDPVAHRVILCLGPEAVGHDPASVIAQLVNKCNS